MSVRKTWIVAALCGCILVATAAQAAGEVPKKINYQGRLLDAVGAPLVGNHNLTFRIFADETGGTALWSEAQAVAADSAGVFAVMLGALDSIGVAFDNARWLEIEADGEVLAPRREMASVPYAFQAINSHLLEGLHPDAFADSGHSHSSLQAADGEPAKAVFVDASGKVGVGTQTPAAELDVAGTARVSSFQMQYGAAPGRVLTSDAAGNGAWQTPQVVSDGDWVILGPGIYSAVPGNVSIGTTGGSSKLSVLEASNAISASAISGTSTSLNAESAFGVKGTIMSEDTVFVGAGVLGTSTAAVGSSAGVFGQSLGARGQGVLGLAAHGTGVNYAVRGRTGSPNGYAGYFEGGRNYFQGRVGIGTSAPLRALHIHENVNGSLSYPIKVENYGSNSGTATGVLFKVDGGNEDRGKGAIVYERTDTWNRGDFHILQRTTTNDTAPVGLADAVVTIKNDGRVGIGTKDPAASLDIGRAGLNAFHTDGRVGIGTSSPFTKLAVRDSSSNYGAVLALNTMVADGTGGVFVGNGQAIWRDLNGSGLAATGYKWGLLAVSCKTANEAGAVHGALVDGGTATAEAQLCYRSEAGTLYKVQGDGLASTVMATSDGKRALACPESPEAWFEDYGSGEIKSGSCHVDLDPLFLDCITVDKENPLKVFVQLTSPLEQQYYVKKGETGFDVIVVGAGAGAAVATFDYKVLGKWRGNENFRFERVRDSQEAVRLTSADGE